MVHFPGFARTRLWIQRAVTGFYPAGFPHSEIPGSKPVCGSPRLIAACHVLHRLRLPRHPPCALSSLTTKFTHAPETCASVAEQTSWAIFAAPRQRPIPRLRASRAADTSSTKALIKFKTRLVVTQCYSVVKDALERPP